MNLLKYGQYKYDIFTKLNYNFISGKKILDLGCGDGGDAQIFLSEYGLDATAMDIFEHKNIKNIKGLKFKLGSIYKIPFADSSFDYVFLHDILHHIDEKNQSNKKHISGLQELKRVTKIGGTIIIVEGNRYNPLFYPHMVKMLGHNHFLQSYFNNIVSAVFSAVKFKYFEAHLYPAKFIVIWKIYEKLMELVSPKEFLAYNVAIIKNDK